MKKMYLMVLCLGLGLSIHNTYAQNETGGIAKTAKQTLEIGESYKLKIAPSTSNTLYEISYGVFNPDVYNDFKIVTAEDGSLTLSFETFAETSMIWLYNDNGISLEPASNDNISGNQSWSNERLIFKWNTTVEKFVGSFTWKLDAGTYYLRIARSQKGLSALNLSLGLKDLDGNPVVSRPSEFAK